MIIKIEANGNGQHLFQSQSHRTECWIEGYIEVPKSLENIVIESRGYCELTIKDEVLVDVMSHPEWIPDVSPLGPNTEPSINDILNTLLGVTDDE